MSVTVSLIYLFVVLLPAPAATSLRGNYAVLYRTADKAACDAHAAEWNTKLAPQKYACLTLDTAKMQSNED